MFSLVKLVILFECEHVFIDKPMVITEPAVASTRLLGLGSKLYPSNMPCMLNKDLSRFMQSLSRIRQNRASGRKTLLARVENWQLTVSTSSDKHSFCKESSESLSEMPFRQILFLFLMESTNDTTNLLLYNPLLISRYHICFSKNNMS